MVSSRQHAIISKVVVILFSLLTACSASSAGNSAGNTGGNTVVPTTATSVPGLTFTGSFTGYLLVKATCTPPGQDFQIHWSDDELWTNVSKTASSTFINSLMVNFSQYKGAQTYPLIGQALLGQPLTATPTVPYAGIIVQFGEDPRLYTAAKSGNNNITINADSKSGTLTATLVNEVDPTDTVTVAGPWSCVIAG